MRSSSIVKWTANTPAISSSFSTLSQAAPVATHALRMIASGQLRLLNRRAQPAAAAAAANAAAAGWGVYAWRRLRGMPHAPSWQYK